MRYLLLIAKTKALQEGSDTVRLHHIHHALKNVYIKNPKYETFIYRIFGATHKFPEAKYTTELLEKEQFQESIKYDNQVKKMFSQLKEKNLLLDFMNIAQLNTLDDLEIRYQEFCNSLYKTLDQAFVAPLYDPQLKYTPDEASRQLGLSYELIEELVEDYVAQILHTNDEFRLLLSKMWEDGFFDKEIDYEPLRDLAHKNLGVAKNLRIENGISILNTLREEEDLHKISECLDLLIISAIRLKPKKACESMFESVDELKKFQKSYSIKILQNIKIN